MAVVRHTMHWKKIKVPVLSTERVARAVHVIAGVQATQQRRRRAYRVALENTKQS